jgi:hypothetical protein
MSALHFPEDKRITASQSIFTSPDYLVDPFQFTYNTETELPTGARGASGSRVNILPLGILIKKLFL